MVVDVCPLLGEKPAVTVAERAPLRCWILARAGISAGSTTADIDVTGIVDDNIVEADETVIVQLNSVTTGDPQISVDAGNDTATVSILDNDGTH